MLEYSVLNSASTLVVVWWSQASVAGAVSPVVAVGGGVSAGSVHWHCHLTNAVSISARKRRYCFLPPLYLWPGQSFWLTADRCQDRRAGFDIGPSAHPGTKLRELDTWARLRLHRWCACRMRMSDTHPWQQLCASRQKIRGQCDVLGMWQTWIGVMILAASMSSRSCAYMDKHA